MRIIGVIENMSWLVGTGQEIFGSGGGERLADEIGAPLLGQVPLDPALREAGGRRDAGARGCARVGGARPRSPRSPSARAAHAAGHDPQGPHRPLYDEARRRATGSGRPVGAPPRECARRAQLLLRVSLSSVIVAVDDARTASRPCADGDAGGRRRDAVATVHVCDVEPLRSTVIESRTAADREMTPLTLRLDEQAHWRLGAGFASVHGASGDHGGQRR